jgi:hypothetical protein
MRDINKVWGTIANAKLLETGEGIAKFQTPASRSQAQAKLQTPTSRSVRIHFKSKPLQHKPTFSTAPQKKIIIKH